MLGTAPRTLCLLIKYSASHILKHFFFCYLILRQVSLRPWIHFVTQLNLTWPLLPTMTFSWYSDYSVYPVAGINGHFVSSMKLRSTSEKIPPSLLYPFFPSSLLSSLSFFLPKFFFLPLSGLLTILFSHSPFISLTSSLSSLFISQELHPELEHAEKAF